jgi:hypothetical protein
MAFGSLVVEMDALHQHAREVLYEPLAMYGEAMADPDEMEVAIGVALEWLHASTYFIERVHAVIRALLQQLAALSSHRPWFLQSHDVSLDVGFR